jgi:hypothetical protein
MVGVGQQDQFGFRCRKLQALGVGNADLNIALPLHDEHRFGQGGDQFGGIVGERVDEEALHLRRKQWHQRRVHIGDVDALTGLQTINRCHRPIEDRRIRRI